MKAVAVNNRTNNLSRAISFITPTNSKINHFALIGYKETKQGFDIFFDRKMMNIQLITAFSSEYLDENIKEKYRNFEQVKHQFDCDGSIIINLTQLMELLDNPYGMTDGATQLHDCFMVTGSPTKHTGLVLFYDQNTAYSSMNWDHANVEHVGLTGIFEKYAALFVDECGYEYAEDHKGIILTPNTIYLLKQWHLRMVKQEQTQ